MGPEMRPLPAGRVFPGSPVSREMEEPGISPEAMRTGYLMSCSVTALPAVQEMVPGLDIPVRMEEDPGAAGSAGVRGHGDPARIRAFDS